MAALLLLTVTPATRDQFDELDAKVGESMTQEGGPPPGLMSHVVYPLGDGFVIADVWRTGSEGEQFVDAVLQPMLAGLDLAVTDTTISPVWSFARP